jgi:FdhD protein
MRTPGDEVAHAAGFCLGEGILNSPDDLLTVGYCEESEPNTIDVRLKPERREQFHDLLTSRRMDAQTDWALRGQERVEDLSIMAVNTERNVFRIDVSRVLDCLRALSENQKHYLTTRGSHAALLCDNQLEKLSFGEDVGRHNAVDKAIGRAFLDRKLPSASLLVLSSRISYGLVRKAARAQLAMMISDSRPTTLAVETGKTLNMTLAFPTEGSEIVVVCGEHRIVRE